MTTPAPNIAHNMDGLLERFMNGQTTVEEEQQLARYFRQTDIVRPEWEPYKQMFAYFDSGMAEDHPSQATPTNGRRAAKRWRTAAAVAMMAVAGAAALWWNGQEPPTPAQQPSQMANIQKADSPEPANKPTGQTVSTTQTHIAATPAATASKKQKTPTKRQLASAAPAPKEPATETLQPTRQQIEDYVNEEVVQQKEAVIQAALIERGFVPVVQEDGSIAFQKEPAPISYPQEPVNI